MTSPLSPLIPSSTPAIVITQSFKSSGSPKSPPSSLKNSPRSFSPSHDRFSENPLASSVSVSVDLSRYLSFQDFEQKFNLSQTATETENQATASFSDEIRKSAEKGLTMLLKEDLKVIPHFKSFSKQLDLIVPVIASRMVQGGRLIFAGVGSSGRLAIDLAAKATSNCPEFPCLGIIGGGDCAFISAREDFEDSDKEGELAAKKLKLTKSDIVFLISASGATSYNVGFGHAAANRDCLVYYFYNSTVIPKRTEDLFNRINNKVMPLLLDIGPQAIVGSTRLQAYSVSRICLTYLIGQTLLKYGCSIHPDEISVAALSDKLEKANEIIAKNLSGIAEIISAECAVFRNPHANFYRVNDETRCGYVTMLGTDITFREIFIDTAEIPPTFSTNAYRREDNDQQQKRPEYQAFYVGGDNEAAWKTILGREPHVGDEWSDPSVFLLSTQAQGQETYKNRPKGRGNCVIGVDFWPKGMVVSNHLIEELNVAEEGEATTILIVVSEYDRQSVRAMLEHFESKTVIIDKIEDDPLGLTRSETLKRVLNLVSNGVMTLMNKVLGNKMFDVRPSNYKLIDRCIRNIRSEWFNRYGEWLERETLYPMVIETWEMQKSFLKLGIFTYPTALVVFTMLKKTCGFSQAIDHLQTIRGDISLLC